MQQEGHDNARQARCRKFERNEEGTTVVDYGIGGGEPIVLASPLPRRVAVLEFLHELSPADVYGIVETYNAGCSRETVVYYQE